MKRAVLAPQRTLLRGTLSISHLAIARKARGAPTRRPRSPVAYVVALLTQPSLSSLPYPVVAAIRAPIDGKSDGGDRAPSQQCGGGVQGPCQLPACAAAASQTAVTLRNGVEGQTDDLFKGTSPVSRTGQKIPREPGRWTCSPLAALRESARHS